MKPYMYSIWLRGRVCINSKKLALLRADVIAVVSGKLDSMSLVIAYIFFQTYYDYVFIRVNKIQVSRGGAARTISFRGVLCSDGPAPCGLGAETGQMGFLSPCGARGALSPTPAASPPQLPCLPSFLTRSLPQDPPLSSHPLKAVPIAVADEGESESEDDDLKPRGSRP